MCALHSSHGVAWAERKPHEDFIKLRSNKVYGREQILSEVFSYVACAENRLSLILCRADGVIGQALASPTVRRLITSFLASESHRSVVLEGDAGAGKSALLAASAEKAMELFPQLRVFYHFVGAAPGSTDLVRLLRRLWLELAQDQAMPPKEDGLVRSLPSLLERAGQEGGVAIFIDALNQLDTDAEQAQLKWLPSLLPPGVRCVVSMINGTSCHQLLLDRIPTPVRIAVGPLDDASCRRLVLDTMARDGHSRMLETAELQQLLSKPGVNNALWLVSACEELKVAQLKGLDVQNSIATFLDELLGLLQQILARVEQQSEQNRVIAALCLLECSRHGLADTELRMLVADEQKCRFDASSGTLLDPVAADTQGGADKHCSELKGQLHAAAVAAVQEKVLDSHGNAKAVSVHNDSGVAAASGVKGPSARTDMVLPAATWLPILKSLEPFLRPCGGVGQNNLDFFHRAVSKAVRKQYLGTQEQYSFWHGRLADFFERHADPERRAEELPYHLEKILDNSRLLRSLVQWDVFSSLAVSAHGFELLRYARIVGGYSVLANAISEQVRVWGEDSQYSAEEVMVRTCTVAEFLNKAGEFDRTIALLQAGDRHGVSAATQARLLGILSDAVLCASCFGDQRPRLYQHVGSMLEQAITLWRSVPEAQRDEVDMAQAMSNLCFFCGQSMQFEQGELVGRDAIGIFTRLHHPRLAQAEQHLAHIFSGKGERELALGMYRRSVRTFEAMGSAKFDTEYACSCSSVALMLMRGLEPPWPEILAWLRLATVSCEAITGQDHTEAHYYRDLLSRVLDEAGDSWEATAVVEGAEVTFSAEDALALRQA